MPSFLESVIRQAALECARFSYGFYKGDAKGAEKAYAYFDLEDPYREIKIEQMNQILHRHLEPPIAEEASDLQLVKRMVANAGRECSYTRERWVHLTDLLGIGAKHARDLCRRFGFDPNELVGGNSP